MLLFSHSVMSSSVTSWTAGHQASLSFLESAETHVHWLSDAIQLSHPLSSPSALSFSWHQVLFQWVGSHLQSVQRTLKSLVQHHNSKAFLWHSAFFMVLLSHPYMTTRKTVVSTIQISAGSVMSMLFNTRSRFVIAFLPRSKCLLISWLQSPSPVILEPPKLKSVTVSIVSPSIYHEVMGLDAMIFIFWMLSFKPTFFTLLFHFHQEAL